MIVVTVVVAIYAPQLLPETLSAFEVAAASAAIGNFAGQVVGNITGVQYGFDFGAIAIAAISAGVTQGITSELGLSGPGAVKPGFNGTTAARAAIGAVVNQGISVIVGRQESFDWRSVAISAITAPIAAGVTNSVLGEPTQVSEGRWEHQGVDFGTRFAGNLASGLAGGAVRAVLGGGKMDFVSIAADAFGNVLGSYFGDQYNASRQAEKQTQYLEDYYRDLEGGTNSEDPYPGSGLRPDRPSGVGLRFGGYRAPPEESNTGGVAFDDPAAALSTGDGPKLIPGNVPRENVSTKAGQLHLSVGQVALPSFPRSVATE